ncbi:hypothetical protein [Bacillus sp. E(2018)]|uniref:hypothetical protein n=1 Tax=Bacillus sp. E(2018) TaxID=2502239 RepID=UPI0010F78B74|nr:hypothetical protein [Bacillus sp. E(2018)]
MSNINTLYETANEQQRYLNGLVSSPAFEAIRAFQKQLATLPAYNATKDVNKLLKSMEALSEIGKIKVDTSHLFQNTLAMTELLKGLRKVDFLKDVSFTDYLSFIKDIPSSIFIFTDNFNDVTFENLTVLNEVLDEENFKNDSSELNSSLTVRKPNLVSDMTKEELLEVFQSAHTEANKEKSLKTRFQVFVGAIIVGVGVDFAKEILINIVIPILLSVAASNHNYEVAQEINDKIAQHEAVKTVKKVFIKNPAIEKPIGEMAFLRVESHLRNCPHKQSHLSSTKAVSQNTVVFPIEKRGNWILIEVETKTDAFIGWIEESKVVKFKLQ